jgi:hypothetical protein
MVKFLWLAAFFSLSVALYGQGFEVTAPQENVRGIIGEIIKAPVRFKNNTEKPITIVIKKVSAQLGSTQKNFYCIDSNCLDSKIEDYVVKIEPGQTLTSLHIGIESGLVSGESSVKYIAYNRHNPSDVIEFDLSFTVEEKVQKQHVYSSAQISIEDVYPNPASAYAFVDYKIFNDRIKARVVIHNILGNIVSTNELPVQDNKIKIKTDELSPGIYFYTLYVDDKCLFSRKLVVNSQ